MQNVELFHLLLLDQLGRKLDKRHYTLKEGCNLRFFFKSIRYSQDIDLDIHTIRKDTLNTAVNKLLESTPFTMLLRAQQIELINFSEPKQTDTTQRWKIQLKIHHTSLPAHTKLEFSRRTNEIDSLFEAVDSAIIGAYKLTPIYASHYSMQVALWQKIWALILRTETQARDIFDLAHLFTMGIVMGQIPCEMKNRLEEAEANALSIPYESFKSQVVSYLPLDYQQQYIDSTHWETMVLQVVMRLKEARCS